MPILTRAEAVASRDRLLSRSVPPEAGATLDGQTVPVAPRTLEGRQQVLLPADYAAGETRHWQLVWGTTA